MLINTKTNSHSFYIKTKISSKNKAFPLGIFLLLAICLASVNVIYAQTDSTQSSSVSKKQGTITSVKNGPGPDHKPLWNLVGEWNAAGLNSKSFSFDSQFNMTKVNGTGQHYHTISNFHLIGNPIINATGTVYIGTSTVTLKVGPVNNVPTTIVISSSGNLSIAIDPTTTGNHFGKKPIKGTTK